MIEPVSEISLITNGQYYIVIARIKTPIGYNWLPLISLEGLEDLPKAADTLANAVLMLSNGLPFSNKTEIPDVWLKAFEKEAT